MCQGVKLWRLLSLGARGNTGKSVTLRTFASALADALASSPNLYVEPPPS